MSLGREQLAAVIGESGISAAPLCYSKRSLDTDISKEDHPAEISLEAGQPVVPMDNSGAPVVPLKKLKKAGSIALMLGQKKEESGEENVLYCTLSCVLY